MNLPEFEKQKSLTKESYFAERFKSFQSQFPGIVQHSLLKENYIHLAIVFIGSKKQQTYFVPIKHEYQGYISIGQRVNNEAVKNKRLIVVEFEGRYYLFNPTQIALSDKYTSEYKRTKFVNFRLNIGVEIKPPQKEEASQSSNPTQKNTLDKNSFLAETLNFDQYSYDGGTTWYEL